MHSFEAFQLGRRRLESPKLDQGCSFLQNNSTLATCRLGRPAVSFATPLVKLGETTHWVMYIHYLRGIKIFTSVPRERTITLKNLASTGCVCTPQQAILQKDRLPESTASLKAPIRVALYSHDTVGLGHFRRNLLLARSLTESRVAANVLLITATPYAHTCHMPDRVDCVILPSVAKAKGGDYQARRLHLSNTEIAALRSKIINSAIEAFSPDVFIVDKAPCGVLKELVPTLEMLRDRSGTRCVLGLRDILDDPEAARRDWYRCQSNRAIRKYYDQVWIYGDPAIYDLIREYRIDPETASKMIYTGYLDPKARLTTYSSESLMPPVSITDPDKPFVFCTVGGGEDGYQLAEAFVHARLPRKTRGILLTGPLMQSDALRRIRRTASERRDIHVIDMHPEPILLLEKAAHVISMGGYNTMSEIVAFNKRSLIVPRSRPRREQIIRASRFADLGLVDVLDPSRLDSNALTRWLGRKKQSVSISNKAIEFGGLARIQHLLASLLDANGPQVVTQE